MISLFLIYVITKIRIFGKYRHHFKESQVTSSYPGASSLWMWNVTSKLYTVPSAVRLQQRLEGDVGVYFLFTYP